MKLKTQTSFQLVLLKHRNFNGIRLFFWPRKISSILQKVFNTISNKSKKMRKGEPITQKILRNPYKRHPEIPTNENGIFTLYRSPPKCVRFGRRKSLPAENFRVSPDPVTFGTLDPNDKSFLRNAHRNLSMRLRNSKGRKSMKVSGHFAL